MKLGAFKLGQAKLGQTLSFAFGSIGVVEDQKMKKNVAQTIFCQAINPTTGLPITGIAATITGHYSLDAAAFADIGGGDHPTELGNGWYYFEGTADEFDGDVLILVFSTTNPNTLVVGGGRFELDNVSALPESYITLVEGPLVK